MELNREQIVKNIELCIDRPNCIECPNFHLCNGNGFEYQLGNALSLIKELTEENERLRGELTGANKDKQIFFDEIASLEAEAEKAIDIAEGNIRAEIASGGTSCHWCEDKVKADTVRKMQERFIAEIEQTPNANEHFIKAWKSKIDQIAKEMLEGDLVYAKR